MKNTIFTGAGVAIITPMHKDGSTNYEMLAKLIEFQINNGTDAIIACGTTGEASAMNDSEHLAVIEFAVKKVNGRVPVIAGTGSNDTRHAINLSKEAEKLGADALLHVTPYYNKTSQSGLIRHFNVIADAVNIPIILYNVPSRTGMTIAPETYLELSRHKNIVAAKEASGNISAIAKTVALCGDALDIYSGNDDQIVPLLSLGAKGVISVLSNIMPRETHDICKLYSDGKTKESLALQLKLFSLIEAIFCDVNPIPIKAAVSMMGYESGECRMPLGLLSDANIIRLQNEMKKAGLLPANV
ncbi:MAG: 4-hydroxy-tetrahydrodipicolinate synthase [Oscillospiraceae bacterium]